MSSEADQAHKQAATTEMKNKQTGDWRSIQKAAIADEGVAATLETPPFANASAFADVLKSTKTEADQCHTKRKSHKPLHAGAQF